jgi:hypothetical protein
VRSIMERSFVAWLLRTHPRIATLVREISVVPSVCPRVRAQVEMMGSIIIRTA